MNTQHIQTLSDITIRRLNHNDIADVVQLEQASFTMPWSKEQYIAAFTQNAFAAFGLQRNQTLIAYITLYLTAMELEILNIAVASTERQKGLGWLLLNKVLQTAVTMGVQNAILEVRQSNTAALALYAKAGFTQVGLRKNYYQNPLEHALVLRCLLSGG